VLYAVLKPLVLGACRVWFRLTGAGTEHVPRHGSVLLAANHLSVLDPPLIAAVVPREVDFMAKAELFRVPLFGGLIRRLNAHPVDRTGSDAAALRLALRILAAGRALLVFPEGTRGVEGRLGPARAGAGMLAAMSGAPVVPVWIRGTGRALPRGRAVPRPVTVRVTFGAPLRFTRERGKDRYQEISDEIMAAIGRLMAEARDAAPGRRGATVTDPTAPGPSPVGRIH
jgi:1-acyl-sn-glycerol-3-phosphate acyltransferase